MSLDPILTGIRQTDLAIEKEFQAFKARNQKDPEGNELRETIHGVDVQIRYQGASRRMVYWDMLFDGEHVGGMRERYPHSIMAKEGIKTWYDCGPDAPFHRWDDARIRARLKDKISIHEVPYPPENGRMTYYICGEELGDVVKVWKAFHGKL